MGGRDSNLALGAFSANTLPTQPSSQHPSVFANSISNENGVVYYSVFYTVTLHSLWVMRVLEWVPFPGLEGKLSLSATQLGSRPHYTHFTFFSVSSPRVLTVKAEGGVLVSIFR